MGKRSDFVRRPQDAYDTPPEAVGPLLMELPNSLRFCEPCAGSGALVNPLESAGHYCAAAWDTHPRADWIETADARTRLAGNIDCFITNPPWARDILHPIITNLSSQRPTWLLFDADWMHTRQAIPFLPRLRTVLSVGRVKWIVGSPHTGKDNCAWHLFTQPTPTPSEATIRFVGRR